jgi:hypothetical protein
MADKWVAKNESPFFALTPASPTLEEGKGEE